MLLIALCFGLAASGEFSKRELTRLKDAEISGVRGDTWKNDDREKFETLEIGTYQHEDDTEGFRMYIAVELMDKNKDTYLVEYRGKQPSSFDSEFTGECYWTLYMKHGDIKRLKISGYAIQFGVYDEENNTFVILAEEYDDVKSYEELVKRTTTPFPEEIRMKHYYMYEDTVEGETESISQAVRSVKPAEEEKTVYFDDLDD